MASKLFSATVRVALVGCFAYGVSQCLSVAAPIPAAPKSAFAPVKAIIDAKCVKCHNDKRHPESVDLSSYDAVMKSGDEMKAVVPGHPDKSSIVLYVDGTKNPRMPFKAAPLSAKEISTIRSWVKAGAKK